MERTKYFLGLILIMIYLIHDYKTMENQMKNEIGLKRIRRIIRGHLAKPGQVNNCYF
jgi:hypothetical protein